jgi:hypothetical protein
MAWYDPTTWFSGTAKKEEQSSPIPQAPVSAGPSPVGSLSSTDTGVNMGGRRRRHRKTKKAGRRHRKTKSHRKH